MKQRSYDKKLDATAGELRADGCAVDSSVPDDAWIPRAAFARPPLAQKQKTRELITSFSAAEPFTWTMP
jgi:hypothetical protein